MKKAGLLTYPRWGMFQITKAGRDLLQTRPPKIDLGTLKNYASFLEFYTGTTKPVTTVLTQSDAVQLAEETPDELIATAHKKLRKQIQSELLTNVLECSAGYFERLVVKLLITIGYGGSREDAGQAIGRSHDGGIDGEIQEDKLGLDTIYIQAKRWQGNVGSKEIQAFVGALTGKRAHKGVFITTSKFTKEAIDFVSRLDKRVVLIDGEQLAELMFEYGLGVTSTNTYVVKRIDADFFDKDAV